MSVPALPPDCPRVAHDRALAPTGQCACQRCQRNAIRQALPKRAIPSWIRLINHARGNLKRRDTNTATEHTNARAYANQLRREGYAKKAARAKAQRPSGYHALALALTTATPCA